MAVIDGYKTSNEIWDLCRIDENWQIEKWGRDDLEEAVSERKRDDFLHAARYYYFLVIGWGLFACEVKFCRLEGKKMLGYWLIGVNFQVNT